jgi:phasin family protein
MSKPFTNPFFEADMSKIFDVSKMFDMSKMTDMSKMFDMSKFSEMPKMWDMSKFSEMPKMFDMSKICDMSKMTGNSCMPQLDIEAAYALQRKNMEAFTALSQAAYENFQSLWRRQADCIRQIVEEMTQTMQAIISSPTTEGKTIKQAEVSKSALDKYLASLRDASETIAKCNTQALETVSTRMNEGMSELRGIVKTDRAA